MDEKNEKHIIVDVDKDLEDLIEGFLENRTKELFEIETAVKKNDITTIDEITHNMIGSGQTYGFDFITAIGRDIKKAVAMEDKARIKELLADFRESLDNLTINFVEDDN